jgi:hypothetical protein
MSKGKVSIAELRIICRNHITFSTENYLDRFCSRYSIYLTWVCIKLKLTANNVTVLSAIFCLIGAFLLSLESNFMIILGSICFIVFQLLDCSDGHVGRYNNQSSVYGHFLDYYMHVVSPAAMFTGLVLGTFALHFNSFIAVCGLLALLTPIMIHSILNCGWTVICWERLNVLRTGKEVLQDCKEDNNSKEENEAATNKKNLVSKRKLIRWFLLLSTSVFSQYAPFALFILALTQIIINLVAVDSFDFRPILIIYVGIVGPFYVIYLLWKRFKTNAFEGGYRRLFQNPNEIKLPRDYFL